MKTLSKIISVFVMLLFCSHVKAQETDDNYVIKKGDMLIIAVMGHPEFSLENIIVLPDGYVQFPGLGSIQASGMSVKAFTKLVTESVGKYVLNPVVTVFISALPNQIINVVGYVNRPGNLPIFEPISLTEALSKCGGIKSVRKCKEIMIMRGDSVYEKIRVKDLFSDDPSIRSQIKKIYVGDTVYVVEPREINWSQLSFFTTLGYLVISLVRII